MKFPKLDDSDVLAVLVYGRSFSCDAEAAQDLARAVEKLGKKHGKPLIVIPVGDFSDADAFSGTVVVGVEVSRAAGDLNEQGKPSGDTQECTPVQFAQAKTNLSAVAASLWKLTEERELEATTDDDDQLIEGLLLTSCGPLAAGWAETKGEEHQVSADGTSWMQLETTAAITLRAQYD